MTENHDDWDPAFEDRVRGLLEGDVAARGVSVTSVIAGAHKRRARRRATAAGSSVAVLGVAAGVVAFGMHSAGSPPGTGSVGTEAAGSVTSGAGRTTVPTTAKSTESTGNTGSTGSTGSTAGTAETCSASVTGPTPALTPMTAEGLDFETLSGTTAGIPWTIQMHLFPDRQTWLNWRHTQTTLPDPPAPPWTVGPPAMLRLANTPDLVSSAAPTYFGFNGGGGIGPHTGGPRVAYVDAGRMAPNVDHLCLQFAHHAEFVPVYRFQGGSVAVASWATADKPSSLIGYDASGQVVGTSTLDVDWHGSLSTPPSGQK